MNLALCNSCHCADNMEDQTCWDWFKQRFFCCCCAPTKPKPLPTPPPQPGIWNLDEPHLRFITASDFLMVFPYTGPHVERLVGERHDPSTIDMTLWDIDHTYVLTSGRNLQYFGLSMSNVLGCKFEDLEWPPQIRQFTMSILKETLLKGKYVNVVTLWGGRTWHIHTHPVFNQPRGRRDTKIIGCVFVAEPSIEPLAAMQLNNINIEGTLITEINE